MEIQQPKRITNGRHRTTVAHCLHRKGARDKGGTYSVQASGDLQHHPNDEALLRIAFQTDPQKYNDLIPIV